MRRLFISIYALVLLSTFGVVAGSTTLVAVRALPERNHELEALLAPPLTRAAARINSGEEGVDDELRSAFGPAVARLPSELAPLDSDQRARLTRGEVVVDGNELERRAYVELAGRGQVLELELLGIRNRVVHWTALARSASAGTSVNLDELDALTRARLEHRPVARSRGFLMPADRVLYTTESGVREFQLAPASGPSAIRWYALAAMLALSALAVLTPLLPLYRQLNALELCTRALSRGALSARVPLYTTGGPVFSVARQLNEMADQIERTLRDNEELLQSVAHEMRTPISRVVLAIELLDHDDAEERSARVDEIRRTLAELHALTDELLEFARLGAPARALRLERIDLREILEDVVAVWGAPLDAPERPALIMADAALIERALTNLLANATRYATGARVLLQRRGPRLLVMCDDDGSGIPVGERERVFEPFVRLEQSRSRATGGVGLGLAIVRRIARAHGGEARVTASPSGGTRVTLELPRAQVTPNRAPQERV